MNKMLMKVTGIMLPQEDGVLLMAGKTWTVLDLKTKIQELTKIPSKDQILVGETQVPSDQPIPLKDNSAMLQTILPWMTSRIITVSLFTKLVEPKMLKVPVWIYHPKRAGKPAGPYDKIDVEVEASASVKQLKMKIDEMKGIAPIRQDIIAREESSPRPPMTLLDTDRLEDVLPVGLNETYKLILGKKRRRNTTAIKVAVPLMGIVKTLNMEPESDTFFTLRAKIRKHVIPFLAESETFSMNGQVDNDFEVLDGGFATLGIFKITLVHVKANLSEARTTECLATLSLSAGSSSTK